MGGRREQWEREKRDWEFKKRRRQNARRHDCGNRIGNDRQWEAINNQLRKAASEKRKEQRNGREDHHTNRG